MKCFWPDSFCDVGDEHEGFHNSEAALFSKQRDTYSASKGVWKSWLVNQSDVKRLGAILLADKQFWAVYCFRRIVHSFSRTVLSEAICLLCSNSVPHALQRAATVSCNARSLNTFLRAVLWQMLILWITVRLSKAITPQAISKQSIRAYFREGCFRLSVLSP